MLVELAGNFVRASSYFVHVLYRCCISVGSGVIISLRGFIVSDRMEEKKKQKTFMRRRPSKSTSNPNAALAENTSIFAILLIFRTGIREVYNFNILAFVLCFDGVDLGLDANVAVNGAITSNKCVVITLQCKATF
ncbi:unnamed protein product [Dracunculus medinensis]|uniref:Transmembrane protein n=1 Tax=Dracunculus medinensis TaxID=318479 RepID=A0A0N4URZ4_DRAME|nr:unnamed protein product [Dracunculus medinensis]